MSYSIDLWPLSREQNVKPWSGMYMQQSTYRHDFVPTNGISPRNRQTNYPYGADAPKADIPGPYTNFRPRFADPLPQHIRDLDGQRFDDQPLTERQRVKRGEEWIGGRRYDEPLTDRGQYYDRDRGRDVSPYRFQERARNGSPERYYDRGRANERGRDYDRGRNESPTKYEKPMQPMIDSYADRRMTDRTTYKDYGEFLQEKIKLDELKKQPVEYPAANLGANYLQERYLRPEERQLRHQIDVNNARAAEPNPENQDARPHTVPTMQTGPQYEHYEEPKSTNSGVYLFIRTNKLAKADVVKALQEGRSVLANSYGQLKGVATNREIQLLEGNEGWNTRASMTRTGDFWLDRSQDSTEIDDMILVIWFPTFNDAEKWVISERKFKTPSFPESYGSDVMILPLNDSQPQERIAYTYLMTEYPRQLDPVMFREVFVPKIKEVLLRKFGIDGFFIQSVGAKVIRGHWIKPSSLVTCIRFNTRKEALDLFLDPEYKQIRQEIHRRIEQLPFHVNWFKPVSFLFTLDKYV
uniref:Uncharacterized protein LOC111133666 isoform X32 n=1 Tax=Crassostrea virginica TaxID=6565 RepID=A0A8B8EBD6_CRAVI|nr:uncharacterized protein LOC111133666 isoform X32 [Crassostrea virginica]